jgi:hypothetical protein
MAWATEPTLSVDNALIGRALLSQFLQEFEDYMEFVTRVPFQFCPRTPYLDDDLSAGVYSLHRI